MPQEGRETGVGGVAEDVLWARIRAAFPAPPPAEEEGAAPCCRRRAKLLRRQQLNPAVPRTNTTPFREAERFYKRADRAVVLRAALDPRCPLSRAAHGVRRAKLACELEGEVFAGGGEGAEEDDRVVVAECGEHGAACRAAVGEEDEDEDEDEEKEKEETAGFPAAEDDDSEGRAGKGPVRRRGRRRRTAAYVLPAVPGLVIIPGALAPRAQRDLVRACVRDYARDPNLTNLHDHYDMPPEGLWALVERQIALDRDGGGTGTAGDRPASWVKLKYKADGDGPRRTTARPPQPSKRTLSSPTGPDPAEYFAAEKPDPPASPTVPQLAPSALFRKLRWVTLGYQYHWSSKTYRFDRRYPFPPLAAAFARAVARAAEGVAGNNYPGSAFQPEAGVLNFYQPRDALLDRSEVNIDAPLVSLSLGLSCVFLVGTASREDRPSAILLRSGDVLVMSGPSRKCFHGVPRVLEGSLPNYLQPDSADARSEDSGWDLVGAYMEQSRINLNIRQVF